jgi:hypothetical protein
MTLTFTEFVQRWREDEVIFCTDKWDTRKLRRRNVSAVGYNIFGISAVFLGKYRTPTPNFTCFLGWLRLGFWHYECRAWGCSRIGCWDEYRSWHSGFVTGRNTEEFWFGSHHSQQNIFPPPTPRLLQEPLQPVILWVSRALPTEVNQPVDEADHIPTSGVEVKRVSGQIFPPRRYAFMVLRGPN